MMLLDEQNVLRIALARDAEGRDLGKNLQYSQSVTMRVQRDGKGLCLIDTANQGEMSLGQSILDGTESLESLEARVASGEIDPRPVSGHQELLENLVNRAVWAVDSGERVETGLRR